MSADWSATPIPVPYADFGDPQSLNLYQFVGGNPASKTDPDGHDGGTAAVVWDLFAGGTDISAGMWTVGSVALPGLLGGGLAYGAINSTANNYDTVANAEMRYQVSLNNIAVQINQMGRAGKSTEQLRREWEKLTGQKWPKDPDTGRNQDAHHKEAKADGGSDTAKNIEPKPHGDHVDHHKKNGDFKRWGKRAHQKPPVPKPEPPKPEPPKPEPPKTEPQK